MRLFQKARTLIIKSSESSQNPSSDNHIKETVKNILNAFYSYSSQSEQDQQRFEKLIESCISFYEQLKKTTPEEQQQMAEAINLLNAPVPAHENPINVSQIFSNDRSLGLYLFKIVLQKDLFSELEKIVKEAKSLLLTDLSKASAKTDTPTQLHTKLKFSMEAEALESLVTLYEKFISATRDMNDPNSRWVNALLKKFLTKNEQQQAPKTVIPDAKNEDLNEDSSSDPLDFLFKSNANVEIALKFLAEKKFDEQQLSALQTENNLPVLILAVNKDYASKIQELQHLNFPIEDESIRRKLIAHYNSIYVKFEKLSQQKGSWVKLLLSSDFETFKKNYNSHQSSSPIKEETQHDKVPISRNASTSSFIMYDNEKSPSSTAPNSPGLENSSPSQKARNSIYSIVSSVGAALFNPSSRPASIIINSAPSQTPPNHQKTEETHPTETSPRAHLRKAQKKLFFPFNSPQKTIISQIPSSENTKDQTQLKKNQSQSEKQDLNSQDLKYINYDLIPQIKIFIEKTKKAKEDLSNKEKELERLFEHMQKQQDMLDNTIKEEETLSRELEKQKEEPINEIKRQRAIAEASLATKSKSYRALYASNETGKNEKLKVLSNKITTLEDLLAKLTTLEKNLQAQTQVTLESKQLQNKIESCVTMKKAIKENLITAINKYNDKISDYTAAMNKYNEAIQHYNAALQTLSEKNIKFSKSIQFLSHLSSEKESLSLEKQESLVKQSPQDENSNSTHGYN